jgi:hypothetical protein
VPSSLGALVLRRRGLLKDTLDAFGREAELNESEAAVEGFAIVGDQPASGRSARQWAISPPRK